MRIAFLLCTLTLLNGCVWGTQVKYHPAAHTPGGAQVSFALTDGARLRRGELFAIDERNVYVYNGVLYRVAWDRIQRIGIDKVGQEYVLYNPAQKTAAERARYAPMSRFPQGMNAELLADVLRRLEQPRLEEPQ